MTPRKGAGGGRRRWGREIRDLLVDLPRQHAALRHAMDAFGDEFDLARFKSAFEETKDMELYNRVQAVEHSVARVQTYLGELAIAGAKMAALELPKDAGGGAAERAFSALVQEGVLDSELAARLKKAQGSRNRIEHGYIDLSAGEVHTAATEVSEISLQFVRPFRAWIEPYLDDRR
jgi:uncharacterized protein YutE (UPF0331/DUF86 family)